MAERKDGGPAFPVLAATDHDTGRLRGMQTGTTTGWELGMSLRDYFAAKAMQSLILAANGPAAPAFTQYAQQTGRGEAEVIAAAAYEYADAMLAHREKETGK